RLSTMRAAWSALSLPTTSSVCFTHGINASQDFPPLSFFLRNQNEERDAKTRRHCVLVDSDLFVRHCPEGARETRSRPVPVVSGRLLRVRGSPGIPGPAGRS